MNDESFGFFIKILLGVGGTGGLGLLAYLGKLFLAWVTNRKPKIERDMERKQKQLVNDKAGADLADQLIKIAEQSVAHMRQELAEARQELAQLRTENTQRFAELAERETILRARIYTLEATLRMNHIEIPPDDTN